MDLFTVSAILGILGILFVLFSKWRYQYWARKGIPQLKPQLFYGDFKPIITGAQGHQEYFLDLYKKCKVNGWSQVGLYSLLRPEWMVCDLKILKHILIKDFEYFPGHGFYHHGNEPITEHLFNMDGEEWKKLRVKLTPTFTTGKMKMMFETLLEKANTLKKVAGQCADNKKGIHIKDVVARFGTDVIGSCAFGIECNSLEEPDNKLREIGRMALEPNAFKVIMEEMVPFNILGNIGYRSFHKQVSSYFSEVVLETIKYREQNNVQRKDFMQLMLQLKNQSAKGSSLTETEIISQSFVFYIAGFETSSTTTTFALMELSHNQDIQDKLREEINEVLEKHNGEITYDSVMEMEYLDNVVHETLRKYPPIAMIPRQCGKRYKVPGSDLIIEKGTRVYIPAWGIQKDPEYYPDPERFNPDNFTKENRSKRPDLAWIPFGEGPRICIGLRFGMMQVKVGLISLLRDFRYSPHEKTKWPLEIEESTPVLAIKGEVWLKVDKL